MNLNLNLNLLAISIKNMKASRGGRLILDIKEMLISEGEHVAVVGPNGAGKSTLLQIINALLPYQSGEARLFGETIAPENAHSLRQMSSLVFQEPLLLDNTVYENIALPLKFRKIPQKQITPLVDAAMDSFHCGHLSSRHALSLSGGEAQRVCLARALVHRPRLLLLDEPFTALDAAVRTAILADLKAATKNAGMTAVLISHNYQDVLFFADRAVALADGKVVQDGAPETLLRYPATKEVASLVGMDNIFPCRTERQGENILVRLSDEVSFCRKEPGVTVNTCCLPGDTLTILDGNSTPATETTVVLQAVVTHIMPGIGIYQVTFAADDLSFIARIPREKALDLQIGAPVRAAFDTAGAHLI